MAAASANTELLQAYDRLDEIDLALTLAGEKDEPLPTGEEDALRAERAELQRRISASRGPWCQICGWRKWGTDSWNGRSCKCPSRGRA